jgi:hypothetical protein
MYCYRISDHVPMSVTHLIIDSVYTILNDGLSNCITHLTFGDNFDEHILGRIPCGVTHLKFGNKFNQQIDYLLNSITHLTLGDNFNRPISRLPYRLSHLTFGKHFNQSIRGIIPYTVTHLNLGYEFNQSIESALPDGLLQLTVESNVVITRLPRILDIFREKRSRSYLPNTITHLRLNNFHQELIYLPESLKYLEVNKIIKLKF